MPSPGFVAALIMMCLAAQATTATAGAPQALEALSFLLGEGEAAGGGSPGQASGGFTFAAGSGRTRSVPPLSGLDLTPEDGGEVT
jgi:hypothetical protein